MLRRVSTGLNCGSWLLMMASANVLDFEPVAVAFFDRDLTRLIVLGEDEAAGVVKEWQGHFQAALGADDFGEQTQDYR